MKIFPLRRLIRYRFFLPTSKYARNAIDNLNVSFTRERFPTIERNARKSSYPRLFRLRREASLCIVQRLAKTARAFLRRTSTDEKSQSVGPGCRSTSWDAYNFDRCLHGKKQAGLAPTLRQLFHCTNFASAFDETTIVEL